MLANYRPFIDRLIRRYEGGYGWNKADPGGPTKYGITCYDLAEHRRQKMSSMSAWAPEVRDMSRNEAEDIYRLKYATAIRFDELPSGVDCVMLDYTVNSGAGRSVRVARVLVGLPPGGMDQALVDALRHADPSKFIRGMCDERLRFMHAIRGGTAWSKFGRGWGIRVSDLRAYSLSLASGVSPSAAPDAPDLSEVPTPKATNVGTETSKTTGAGTIAAGVAAHEAGFHWIAVGFIMLAVVAAGIAYEIWSSHRATTANNVVHV